MAPWDQAVSIRTLRRIASPGDAANLASKPELGGSERHRHLPHDTACLAGSSTSPPASTLRSVPLAADERLQPGQQLGEGEGLGEVVVPAHVKARQAVGQRVAGGEEEHRGGDPLGPDGLAHVAAVGVGQADVDDEQVGDHSATLRSSSDPVA